MVATWVKTQNIFLDACHQKHLNFVPLNIKNVYSVLMAGLSRFSFSGTVFMIDLFIYISYCSTTKPWHSEIVLFLLKTPARYSWQCLLWKFVSTYVSNSLRRILDSTYLLSGSSSADCMLILTNRFHIVVRLFSTDHRWPQNVVRTN